MVDKSCIGNRRLKCVKYEKDQTSNNEINLTLECEKLPSEIQTNHPTLKNGKCMKQLHDAFINIQTD